MATNNSPSVLGSCGPAVEKACPCGVSKQGKWLWMTCTNENCNNKHWHSICAGLEKVTRSSINSFGEWTCPLCVVFSMSFKLPVFNKDPLQELSDKIESLKRDLHDEMKTQKKHINEDIKSYAEVVKKNISDNTECNDALKLIGKDLHTVKANICDKAEAEFESKARERKSKNVCVFNVPESDSDDSDVVFKDEVSKIRQIFRDKVDLKKEDVLDLWRCGKTKDKQKIRPIIIKFSNMEIKQKVLKLRNLKYKDENESQDIFIHPDRTLKERDAYKALRMELQERRKIDSNLVIRNGKIVPYAPFRRNPQLYWGSE